MTSAKLGQSVMTVALVSGGVIVAGLVMKQLRTTIPFLRQASNGFDT